MSNEPLPDGVSDDELLARVAEGDALAFTTLFRRRQADVYRVAMLMTGSRATAEDVTQDVFLAMMHDARRFESGRASVAAWLCGIARNHALRRLDRERRTVQLPEHLELTGPSTVVQPDPLGELSSAEEIGALRRAVLSLPVRYREVVVLCDLQNLSYVDAAEALECAVGTVRSRLHRARALLEAKMRARQHTNDAQSGAKNITRCPA
jgi:RNA polymerase sigma-70 factor (ECF subfamily)